MAANERIINYHIGRLSDKRKEIRLEAIAELELLGAMEALEPLHAIYENDPEIDVRRAAQKAGREIFLKNRARGET